MCVFMYTQAGRQATLTQTRRDTISFKSHVLCGIPDRAIQELVDLVKLGFVWEEEEEEEEWEGWR